MRSVWQWRARGTTIRCETIPEIISEILHVAASGEAEIASVDGFLQDGTVAMAFGFALEGVGFRSQAEQPRIFCHYDTRLPQFLRERATIERLTLLTWPAVVAVPR
jgi:hypothetical protein